MEKKHRKQNGEYFYVTTQQVNINNSDVNNFRYTYTTDGKENKRRIEIQ